MTRFIWNPEKVNLLLAIEKPIINPRVVSYAAEHKYQEKPEFHVSIIAMRNAKKIRDVCAGNQKLIDDIRTLAGEYTWELEYLPEYFVLEKFYNQEELEKSGYQNIPEHMRRTIIQNVNAPDMDSFYKRLSDLTGIIFEIPTTHVTLFSWADYEPFITQGIGLYSKDDFEKYKKENL